MSLVDILAAASAKAPDIAAQPAESRFPVVVNGQTRAFLEAQVGVLGGSLASLCGSILNEVAAESQRRADAQTRCSAGEEDGGSPAYPGERYGSVEVEAHLATLALLTSVCEYLKRLPAHPMTREVTDKIDAHLAAPQARSLKARLEGLSKELTQTENFGIAVRAGGAFSQCWGWTPEGLPGVQVRLNGAALRLDSPALAASDSDMQDTLLKALAQGIEITLKPVNPRLARWG